MNISRQLSGSSLDRPLIVFGYGRTGTTIISECLFRCPDLGYLSNYQQKFPRTLSVNLVRNIFENSLWEVQGHKKQLNAVSHLNRFKFIPTECYAAWDYLFSGIPGHSFSGSFLHNVELDQSTIDRVRDYFLVLLQMQRKRRLAIKITGPSRIGVLHQIFPDAIFLRVTRRLVPTISSFINADFNSKKKGKLIWWDGPYSDIEREAIVTESSQAVRLALQLKKIDQITKSEAEERCVKITTVSYERFVEDKHKVISGLLEPTGLEERSADVMNYLSRTNIVARNKLDAEYFSEDTVATIESAFNG